MREQPTLPSSAPARFGREVVPGSTRLTGSAWLWAERSSDGLRIVIAGSDATALAAFDGRSERRDETLVLRCPPTPATAAALRATLANLRPVPLGTRTSAGFGDRLGLATPGHVDALRASGAAERILPVFAQQSMRENERTGRTPQEVLDDATIGAFVGGWTGTVGADADHLKREAEIDLCLAAGYSIFTLDPGEHVDEEADALQGAALADAFATRPPWSALETDPDDLRRRLGAGRIDLGDRDLGFGAGELERAAVKYGAAVSCVARLSRHLRRSAGPETAEIEVSVDETATPTTLSEHAYLALELRRLGVDWVGMAPRFVGDFEKGVDYRGDLARLACDLDGHARVARALGPYKLSLHSGSDKFGAYPIAAEASGGAVHLKTSGTSYLEGLRVVGGIAPELLRAVAALALERYAHDARTYHVSARPERVPDPAKLPGRSLLALLELPDARQLLHVTFGSALAAHGDAIRDTLEQHPTAYREALRRHFERHLVPLLPAEGAAA